MRKIQRFLTLTGIYKALIRFERTESLIDQIFQGNEAGMGKARPVKPFPNITFMGFFDHGFAFVMLLLKPYTK